MVRASGGSGLLSSGVGFSMNKQMNRGDTLDRQTKQDDEVVEDQ